MNEELQKKLIEWAQAIGNMASEQLPDFANQIVAYTAWNAHIWLATSVICGIFIAAILILFVIAEFSKRNEYESNCGFIMFLILFFSTILVVGLNEYSTIKKCELAPKLVILDYIGDKCGKQK